MDKPENIDLRRLQEALNNAAEGGVGGSNLKPGTYRGKIIDCALKAPAGKRSKYVIEVYFEVIGGPMSGESDKSTLWIDPEQMWPIKNLFATLGHKDIDVSLLFDEGWLTNVLVGRGIEIKVKAKKTGGVFIDIAGEPERPRQPLQDYQGGYATRIGNSDENIPF